MFFPVPKENWKVRETVLLEQYMSSLGFYLQASIRPYVPVSIANSSVCTQCRPPYKQINKFYLHLESVHKHGVCLDVVDVVTRFSFCISFKYMYLILHEMFTF